MTLRAAAAGAIAVAACAPPAAGVGPSAALPSHAPDDGRASTAELVRIEDEALAWLSAADPRLAVRTGVAAPHQVLERIGTDAVLAEDATAIIRGGSLDLFAFRARARALSEAARSLATLRSDLPEAGPLGSGVGRPRLEREVLSRLIDEERARADDEAALGDASGDLVRAMVASWTPPATPQDVPDRDTWAAKHLLEIRDSLRESRPHNGPPDLDNALYPLERLLAPLQYPRGTAALAQVRLTLDESARPFPRADAATRVARAVQVHLGLAIDPITMPARLEGIEARLRRAVDADLRPLDDAARSGVLSRARALVFAEGNCPPVADSRVRSMPPPPERSAICGALTALGDDASRTAAMVALHDDVLFALSAVAGAPPSRAGLMSHPADEDVDTLVRMTRERPAVALGPALAAEILLGGDGRVAAWRALGEAPLDVVARELGVR